MDLRIYYQKIREQEANIADEFPVIVSRETPDGGKAGNRTEVSRSLAAKMVVEGLARLATDEESKEYRETMAQAKRTVDEMDGGARDRRRGAPKPKE